jgi:hypothetical protein
LLSRQDEATLAAWLRDLGPAAAHVQELTIPILAAAPMPVPKPRGVLSGLRRARGERAAATDGCGLDEFARQVSAYVAFAYAHRGIPEPVVAPPLPAHVEPADAPPEPDVVGIKTAPAEAMGDDENGWIAISLDDACKEPAPPRHIWALTPVAGYEELRAAAALTHAAPESDAMVEPQPEPESLAIGEQELAAIGPAAPPVPRRTTKKQGRRRGKTPAQDDGGLFDPEQCGFAALVAKLNEITDNNHAEQASADTTVPLIAY